LRRCLRHEPRMLRIPDAAPRQERKRRAGHRRERGSVRGYEVVAAGCFRLASRGPRHSSAGDLQWCVMRQRPFISLAVVAVGLGFAACGVRPSGGDSPDLSSRPGASVPTPEDGPGRWTLYTLRTRGDGGSAALAFTGDRSAVVLGGGRVAALRLGVGLADRGSAPADVLDGPVAAGAGRAALLVMRPASGGQAQLAVVGVAADGSRSAVLPVATVAGPRAVDYALLGSSDAGELTVVWHELDDEQDTVRLAIAPPASAFGPAVTVGRAEYDAPELDLALGVGPAGHVVVVTNDGRGNLIARVRPPGGELGSPEVVGPTHGQDQIDIGVDADGNVLVAWSTVTPGEEAEDGNENFNNRVGVYAARRDVRDGRFAQAQRLLASDPESEEGPPDVAAAVGAEGRSVVVFQATRAGRGREPLLAFGAGRRERFGSPQRLAKATDPEAPVDLAASSDGRVLVATRHDARVLAARRASGARRFGKLTTLAPLRSAESPVAGFAPDAGAAVVTWLGSTSAAGRRMRAIRVAVHR